MELDFSKCHTPEEVQRVFAASRERLEMIRRKMEKLADELKEPDADD